MKRTRQEDFMALLSPDSKNFCGSGLTLEQFFLTGQAQDYQRSWGIQPAAERKRRLSFIMDMVREKDRVVAQHGIFSSAFCDWVIEAVIQGSPDDVELWLDAMKPGEDMPDNRFAKFIELGRQFVATMPSMFPGLTS